MLEDSIIMYYFLKLKYLLCKYSAQSNRLENKYRVFIQNQLIQGKVSDLIVYVEKNYQIVLIDVKSIHKSIDWNLFYKDLNYKEISHLYNYHMEIIVASKLSYPIVVTSNEHGQFTSILDGFHRIKKAHILRKKRIKAYIIPELDLLKFIT